MYWINVFGLFFILIIMIPNIVFAIKCKDGFDNKWNNKYVEIIEQIGRFGCFGFMIINIPGTWFGWWSDEAFACLYSVFKPVEEGEMGIGGVIALIFWCIYFLPVGILSFRHFSKLKKK